MKKLPAVIVEAPNQSDRVQRLLEYCIKLDGTYLEVLHDDKADGLIYPHCNNAALKCAARHFKGKSFMWLEPDSIPIKKGWLASITEEWNAIKDTGPEFMISPDKNPPLDMVGGIGVYGPNTHWLIPDKIKQGGWDGWIINHLSPLIARSSLIQHSYGIYHTRQATPHRFPRDNEIIRPDAVIFHRDRFQDLIIQQTPKRFLHSGDFGDIIAALPVIRQLGGGELVITDKELPAGKRPRGTMKERFDLIKPLLDRQQYIYRCVYEAEPEGITHDFTTFRTTQRVGNLAQWQAAHLGVEELDLSPWIQVDCTPHPHVLVSRSPRYHNPEFPWHQVVHKFRNRLLFVGLPEECDAFNTEFKCSVRRAKTDDLLSVAEVVGGSSLGFYNQSCPFWIAAAMGRKLVQESHPDHPNSLVERPNAYYTDTPLGIWRIVSGLALQ